MSAISFHARARPRPNGRAWTEAALVAAGLAAIVAVRLAATRAGLDPVAVGAGFGLALLGLVAASHARLHVGTRPFEAALLGGGLGLVLVVAAAAGAATAGAPLVPGLGRAAAPFVPWAAVTVVVAIAEEAVLRGILFDRILRAGGPVVALLGTTALFGLMHVPLYGWHVVPLDLAVGLVLCGLRMATGGVVAPAIAHAVADLATWWI
jgi:membrane protease YdiL (CAAX protease family)